MLIRAKVTPGAKKESLTEVSAGALIITVRQKARQNAANKRVRELVARHLKVAMDAVRLIKGAKGRSKLFDIKGL